MSRSTKFVYCGIPVDLRTVRLREITYGLRDDFRRAADLARRGGTVRLVFVSGEANHRVYNAIAREIDEALKNGVLMEMVVGPLISCHPTKGNAILKTAVRYPDQVIPLLAQMRQKLHFHVLVEDQRPTELVAELPHPPNAEQREVFRLDLRERAAIADFVVRSVEAEKMFCRRLDPQAVASPTFWATNEQIDFVLQWWLQRGRHFDTLTRKEMVRAMSDPQAPKVRWQWSLPDKPLGPAGERPGKGRSTRRENEA